MADIEVKGAEKIAALLKKVADTRTYEEGIKQSALVVEAAAKINAPKDTGALRNSIVSEVSTDGGKVIGRVYTPLEYAPYIEYGTGLFASKGGRKNVPWCYQDDEGHWHSTSGMKPRPFMKPALDDNRKQIKEIMRSVIHDKLS
jgi:HK97 gp10 family phage protein